MKKTFSRICLIGFIESIQPTLSLGFEAKSIAAGSSHVALLARSCSDAQKSNLYCLGENNKGQCGLRKSFVSVPTPVQFSSEEESNTENSTYSKIEFVHVECGSDFTLALSSDHRRMYSSGFNDSGQVRVVVVNLNCLAWCWVFKKQILHATITSLGRIIDQR